MEIRKEDLLSSNDMAKIACNNCQGCCDCCRGMGDTIMLTPYDVFELEKNLSLSFEQLLQDKVELQVHDGLILPNIKMQEERECCGFLSEEGRCTIHEFRPGLCRLFPLGRNYEDGTYQYFVVENACPQRTKSKIKINKWLGISKLKKQEEFISSWHYLLKELQTKLQDDNQESYLKQMNMYFLNAFYIKPYEWDVDFYEQFQQRLAEAKKILE